MVHSVIPTEESVLLLVLQQPVFRAAPGLEGYTPVKATQTLARLRDLILALAL